MHEILSVVILPESVYVDEDRYDRVAAARRDEVGEGDAALDSGGNHVENLALIIGGTDKLRPGRPRTDKKKRSTCNGEAIE